MWSYRSSNHNDFNFGWIWETLSWWGSVLYVSVFLLKSLGRGPFLCFFLRSCSMDSFFFVNNVPLKVQVSIFPSCWINSSLMPFWLSPHHRQSSFRYLIDEVLGIWYDLGWYCLLVFLWVCRRWFRPLWWWYVYICCFYGFKDFSNCGVEYSGGLVSLC